MTKLKLLSYHDPGINYNIYWTPEGAEPYKIPGPTVWSGAAPSVANPSLGEKKGPLTEVLWSQWIITEPLPSMYYTYWIGTDGINTTTSSTYTPSWPTVTGTVDLETTTSTDYSTPTAQPTSNPTATITTPAPTPTKPACSKKGPRKGAQCGGKYYHGPTVCRDCRECVRLNSEFFPTNVIHL